MDEKKLIKLLDEKFTTKNELGGLKNEVSGLKNEFSSLKNEVSGFRNEFDTFCYEMRGFRKEVLDEFKVINEKLNESKASSNTFDKMLEKFPMERISRLEKHCKLPKFVPN